jgi:cleavage and polyadenylation specificity factor subunit 1
MQCFTELAPPTAVTHSLSLPFTSGATTNLIVAKTSLLQIFSIKNITVELEPAGGANEDAKDANTIKRQLTDEDGFESSFLVPDSVQLSTLASTTKLVLVGEYALAGTITSMARIKTPESKSGGESLLLSFKDAKLSLVEWDPERHGLSTVSIHYYEQEEIGGSPWDPYLSNCFNYLTADPRSRCAALKFGARNLAILPFRQGDEDTEMDDWDEELDGPRPTAAIVANENKEHEDTPYAPSFVLRLSSLDPALIHTVHLAFLYEYREPTFGILSSTLSPSSSLLDERKDQLSYMVFTLDLHQKASTTILVVRGLPYDLFKVIPLPSPVGGALLVGGNELIHIDQSGKANGVAVNALAKACTSFGLVDQSSLEMRLEGCAVEQLSADNGEMLIVLNTGELAILSFRMDGRSVSGLSLRRVPAESGVHIGAQASCASLINLNSMFIGSEDTDSVVLGWSRKLKQAGRRRSQPTIDTGDDADADLDGSDEDQDEDDDDLYGDATAAIPMKGEVAVDSANSKAGDYVFRIHDSLVNIAPLRDVTLSKPESPSDKDDGEVSGNIRSDLELIGVTGRNTSGSLAILKREIEPNVIGRFEFPEARGIWTLCAKRPSTKTLEPEKSEFTLNTDSDLGAQFDRLMIVSKSMEDAPEESSVYVLTAAGFEALADTEFEPAAGATIECGTVGNGMRVVQVLKSEVRSYDGGRSSLFPSFLLPGIDEASLRCMLPNIGEYLGRRTGSGAAAENFHSINGNYFTQLHVPCSLLY